MKIGERNAGTFVGERHVKIIEICAEYLLIEEKYRINGY
jgi:hypothetical protein